MKNVDGPTPEALAELLAELPPAPDDWVRRARALGDPAAADPAEVTSAEDAVDEVEGDRRR